MESISCMESVFFSFLEDEFVSIVLICEVDSYACSSQSGSSPCNIGQVAMGIFLTGSNLTPLYIGEVKCDWSPHFFCYCLRVYVKMHMYTLLSDAV